MSYIYVVPKMSKVVVAGSRTINNYEFVERCIDEFVKLGGEISEIVSGGAIGVDAMAKKYALAHDYKYKEFKPQYKSSNDRKAPLDRNRVMAEYGDVLIVVWNGCSKGTEHMMNAMKKEGKKVHLFYYVEDKY